jgi:hypothetical protein
MSLDGRLCEALRYRPRPLPFPRLLGPHSLIAVALWVFPSPSGCSAGLAVPPLGAIGEPAWTRARVSLGLRLAPALLLGLGSLYTLSLLTFTVTTWL